MPRFGARPETLVPRLDSGASPFKAGSTKRGSKLRSHAVRSAICNYCINSSLIRNSCQYFGICQNGVAVFIASKHCLLSSRSVRSRARDHTTATVAKNDLLCESLEDRLCKEPIAVGVVVTGAPERKQGQWVAMRFERPMEINYRNFKICDYC